MAAPPARRPNGGHATALGARAARATAALALAGLWYSAGVERRTYTLRRVQVPVLPLGARPIRILHLSDVHMLARQRGKQDWISDLARLAPDLVVDTGDNLAGADGVAGMLRALGTLLERPGAFVFGANDYYAPRPVNPARYLRPPRPRTAGRNLPWQGFAAALAEAGWINLANATATLSVAGRTIGLVGVDDPHLKRDRLPDQTPAWSSADLRIGLVHAPEPQILDRMAGSGAQLLLAGHTHGGQVRLPGVGALVTNCGLDRARARGLSLYRRGPAPVWLHVSAGLGTSPFAPIRFACPPEATLLTLVGGPAPGR